MRILKKLFFVLLIFIVAGVVGVMVIGQMLAPKLSDMEPRRTAAVNVESVQPIAIPRVPPAVAIGSDASTTRTLTAISNEEFPVYEWTGLVKDDESGKPIAGADVMVLRAELSLNNIADGTFIAAATKTDANGKYRLVVDTKTPSAARLRSPVLQASASGYSSAASQFFYEPDGGTADFSLLRGGSISGRVQDEKGAPIAGALVGDRVLIDRTTSFLTYNSMPCYWTTTDANGGFELSRLPAGRSYNVPVRAEGYIPAATPEIGVGEKSVVVMLKRSTTSIDVTVLTHEGIPVVGAVVRARSLSSTGSFSSEWFGVGPPQAVGKTDDGGHCTLVEILAQSSQSSQSSPTYSLSCTWDATAERPLQTVQGKEVRLVVGVANPIEMRFEPIRTITGVFVDADTTAPVAGVRVSPEFYERPVYTPGAAGARQINRGPRPESITGADGRFAIPVAGGGVFYYRLPAGYVEDDPNLGSLTAFIRPDAAGSLVYRIRHGVILPIRVFAPNGRPAPAVYVALSRTLLNVSDTQSWKTDDDGHCDILAAIGGRYTARFTGKEGTFLLEETPPLTNHPEPLDITLQEYGSVSGRVTLDGRPFPNIFVTAIVDGMQGSTATTGRDGNFLVENVAPGSVMLSCTGWEVYSDSGSIVDTFTLAPGEQRKGADIEVASRNAFDTLMRALFLAFHN
ncbi:hypothetical protein BH09SUM1_BH09SUM1_14730 [soil metagenome]